MAQVIKRAGANAEKRVLQRGMSSFNQGSSQLKEAVNQDFGIQQKESFLQFSKAPILDNFGDLPFGEIPETLKYERPMKMTTASNGIRVCTE